MYLACGSRVLSPQANLLQPLADPAALELRLDAVEELLLEAELRTSVQVSRGSARSTMSPAFLGTWSW